MLLYDFCILQMSNLKFLGGILKLFVGENSLRAIFFKFKSYEY